MLETFPFEALPEEPFLPDYNDYLENEADGYPIEMYSLRRLFEQEQATEPEKWAQCEKCKVEGHVKQYVFPSIVVPKGRGDFSPVKLVILGEA